MGSVGAKSEYGVPGHRRYLQQGNFSNNDNYDEDTLNDNYVEDETDYSTMSSVNMSMVRNIASSVESTRAAKNAIRAIDQELAKNPTPEQEKELKSIRKRLEKY